MPDPKYLIDRRMENETQKGDSEAFRKAGYCPERLHISRREQGYQTAEEKDAFTWGWLMAFESITGNNMHPEEPVNDKNGH